jgi:2'-5' RNA ligase
MRQQTALCVVVPEAEAAVAALRQRYDSSAVMGMVAHVTVLFPLGPYAEVADGLASALAGISAFTAALTRVATFGDEVVWLAPEPTDQFRQLIEAATRQFPDWPPYEGTIGEPVPHLTVAETTPAMFSAVHAEVVAKVEPLLPITFDVGDVALFGATDEGRWVDLERFPLDPARR